MAWRGQLSKNIKELRILLCQSSPSSSSTRAFVEKNYKNLKTSNPKLPILIRECSGIEPQLWARYEGKSFLRDPSSFDGKFAFLGPSGTHKKKIAVGKQPPVGNDYSS